VPQVRERADLWPGVACDPALLAPVLIALAGCAAGPVAAGPQTPRFHLSRTAQIDTNCTGCNGTAAHGGPTEQFAATLNGGGAAAVLWSVSGGDTSAGAGSITPSGSTRRPATSPPTGWRWWSPQPSPPTPP